MAEESKIEDKKESFFSTLLNGVNDRLSNPFSLSLLLSWLASNYKLWIVIFSDGEYAPKIEYIDQQLYNWNTAAWLNLLVIPVIVAFVYTFLWPYWVTWVRVYSQGLKNRETKKIFDKQKITPVNPAYQAEFFKQYDDKIYDLKSRLNALHSMLQTVRGENASELSDKNERIKRLAWLRLADQAGVSYEEVQTIFWAYAGDLKLMQSPQLEALKRLKVTKHIYEVLKAGANLPVEPNSNREVSIDWLMSTLKMTREQCTDLSEILLVLGIFVRADKYPSQIFSLMFMEPFDIDKYKYISEISDQ
jgi:hypothetical protein